MLRLRLSWGCLFRLLSSVERRQVVWWIFTDVLRNLAAYIFLFYITGCFPRSAYSSTLKMEAASSSETMVNRPVYHTRRHISEESDLILGYVLRNPVVGSLAGGYQHFEGI
jgi:hypothetical protein